MQGSFPENGCLASTTVTLTDSIITADGKAGTTSVAVHAAGMPNCVVVASPSSASQPSPVAQSATSGVVMTEKEIWLSADRAMIACIREDAGAHSFFTRPPLKSFTLCFEDKQVF